MGGRDGPRIERAGGGEGDAVVRQTRRRGARVGTGAGRASGVPAVRVRPARAPRAALSGVRVPVRMAGVDGPRTAAAPVPVRASPAAQRPLVPRHAARRAAAAEILVDAVPHAALAAGTAPGVLHSRLPDGAAAGGG